MSTDVILLSRRQPGDTFVFNTFSELMSTVSNAEAYYQWTGEYGFHDDALEIEPTYGYKKPLIIIGFRDSIVDKFNFWTDKTTPHIEKYIINPAKKHPDKNFIIFTSEENLHLEIASKNVQVVPWGGDWLTQAEIYPSLQPVFNKNFNSTKTFINLNRGPRPFRVVVMNYLFGHGYDNYGVITYLGPKKSRDNWQTFDVLNAIQWNFDEERHKDIRIKIIEGWKKFYHTDFLTGDDVNIYNDSNLNDNFNNFNTRLRPKYENSFVEIVSEATFESKTYLLSEKTLHTFYGCNFPIILSGCGAVEHLRNIGFDMYDDIIDHSYDTVENPIDRIVTAIESNRRLLVDGDYAKSCWIKNQSRFIKNVETVKTIYDWYRIRTTRIFNQAIKNIKI